MRKREAFVGVIIAMPGRNRMLEVCRSQKRAEPGRVRMLKLFIRKCASSRRVRTGRDECMVAGGVQGRDDSECQ